MRPDRNRLLHNLRLSLTLLAAEGDAALAAIPEGCHKPDELALDFDNFHSAVVANFASELPPDLLTELAAIDDAFLRMPKEAWAEEAVRSHPAWVALRAIAATGLELLQWVDAEP